MCEDLDICWNKMEYFFYHYNINPEEVFMLYMETKLNKT